MTYEVRFQTERGQDALIVHAFTELEAVAIVERHLRLRGDKATCPMKVQRCTVAGRRLSGIAKSQ